MQSKQKEKRKTPKERNKKIINDVFKATFITRQQRQNHHKLRFSQKHTNSNRGASRLTSKTYMIY